MLVRSHRLPRNQRAARLDETPLRTVHQRPPKNIAPSKMPAARAGSRRKVSFIAHLLFLAHFLILLIHPMPGIQTTDGQADNQQHQRPGMLSRMAIVQPDAQRRAEQRRNHHRPADQPHHAQAKPDALRGLPRLEFARRLGADLPAQGALVFPALELRFFTHDETPLAVVQVEKLPLYRLMEPAQIRSANCVAHGDEHVHAGLDQHPLIHGYIDLAFRFVLVSQNAGRERRNAVQPVGQESERAFPCLRNDARNAGFVGEDLERQQYLKIHERRLLHVRPPGSALDLARVRTWFWVWNRRRVSGRPWRRAWTPLRLSPPAWRRCLFPSLRQSPRSCRARSPGSL